MNKGEMLWYESARLDHGRPQPLEGKMYEDEDDWDDWDDWGDYVEGGSLMWVLKKILLSYSYSNSPTVQKASFP